MRLKFKRFVRDEEGAVSVDWVVLTAALVGLAVGTINTIGAATDVVSNNISTNVGSMQVGTGSGN